MAPGLACGRNRGQWHRVVETFHLPKYQFLSGITATMDQIKCKHRNNRGVGRLKQV